MAWVHIAQPTPPQLQALVVKSPASGAADWGLYLDDQGRFMAGRGTIAVVTSRTTAVPGAWHHVAVTYQDSLWHLYINGVREASASGILITRSTGGLALARRGETTGIGDPFGGALDEVELFSRSLSPCEVSQLADLGPAGQCKADEDGDGVLALGDNCVHVANPTQANADGDAAGDACDCGPANASLQSVPAPIRRLTVGTPASDHVLSWCSAVPTGGSGSVHDVVRAEIADLPVGSGGVEICVASGLPGATLNDGALPAADAGFWYLVRGRNACGSGSYGFGVEERVSGACP